MSAAATAQAGLVSRFSETLVDLLDRVEYRSVQLAEQFDPVYRLRYEAYRREEFVSINSQEVVRDEFDDLPNAHCFGVYIDGQLVSSLRFHLMTPDFRLSPSHSVFPDILDPLLDKGLSCIDPGRFTADYEASLAFPALPFLTLRIAVMACRYYGAKYCLSSVRPEHAAFYRRVFGAVQIGDERYYHGLTFPMVLLASDIPNGYEQLLKRYPFFMSTEDEREKMFGPNSSATKAIQPSARLAQRLAELDVAV
jgi:hypothetical protein